MNPSDDKMPEREFRYLALGMRVNFEYEAIAEMDVTLGQWISFSPVTATAVYRSGSERIGSLRIRHFDADDRLIGSCLVDQDEVRAWIEFLTPQGSGDCGDYVIQSMCYETRHGIRWVQQSGTTEDASVDQLFVGSAQCALIARRKWFTIREIFLQFEEFCEQMM